MYVSVRHPLTSSEIEEINKSAETHTITLFVSGSMIMRGHYTAELRARGVVVDNVILEGFKLGKIME